MLRLLAKLLLFVAVLAAPLGMTAAPAAPAHHGMAAGPAAEHCPESGQAPERDSGIADCAMACAAALPAVGSPSSAAVTVIGAATAPPTFARLSGRHLEIATPPPKIA